MTKLIYLTDSYIKTLKAKVLKIAKKGSHWELILDQTIFYPQGGGQLSDKGTISGRNGKVAVTHVRMHNADVLHEGKLTGKVNPGETVLCELDWNLRWQNMQLHSAGHLLHEIIMQTVPGIQPVKADHGKKAFIEYQGIINPKLQETLEKRTNMLIAEARSLTTEMVTYDEIIKRKIPIFGILPKNKPLRLLTVTGFKPIPDGGTQVTKTDEVGEIKIIKIENSQNFARVYYSIIFLPSANTMESVELTGKTLKTATKISLNSFKALLLEQQQEINEIIKKTLPGQLDKIRIDYFGSHGKSTKLIKMLKDLAPSERKSAGMLVNEFKTAVYKSFAAINENKIRKISWFDTSLPGILPPQGNLHIVTQAITEITRIFEKIGFTRVRYPEVDWDWYAFESLNMPKNHPARDEWETFHIDSSKFKVRSSTFNKIVLTPHTSNGQVREMEKGKLPIRMINIAKCYRRQIDISHTPMFHQFEGMYIDKKVSIAHLKGVCDYFFKQFYGSDRRSRLRPFHFQFTEPSFEIDVSCGICHGTGRLSGGSLCKLCKEGWLELGGAGMIHPQVLTNGNIDPEEYSGFAFGWGVERTYMMKTGTQLNDIRILYENDLRFLEQF